MKDMISKIIQGVELFLMALAVFMILFFFVLWSRGAFSSDKLSEIGKILRGEKSLEVKDVM
ncbi:hypothetical protein HY605_01640, partial [Candidatus Peregrinibacteria bacterium]|nr:hypothetical protein [Candidatus Peregrinibacteria bacterium]